MDLQSSPESEEGLIDYLLSRQCLLSMLYTAIAVITFGGASVFVSYLLLPSKEVLEQYNWIYQLIGILAFIAAGIVGLYVLLVITSTADLGEVFILACSAGILVVAGFSQFSSTKTALDRAAKTSMSVMAILIIPMFVLGPIVMDLRQQARIKREAEIGPSYASQRLAQNDVNMFRSVG